MLARAKEIGMSDDEAKAFGTKDALGRSLAAVDRALAKRQQQPAQAPEKPNAQTPAAPDPADYSHGLTAEDFDERIVKAFDGMHNHYKTQLDKLKSEVGQVMSVQREKELISVRERADRMFGDLDEGYHELFGKDSYDKVTETQLAARKEVVKHMGVLAKAYHDLGVEMPAEGELHRRAVHLLHGSKAEELARAKIGAEIEQRKSQVTMRPTQRRTADVKQGDELALRNLRSRFRDFNGAHKDESEGLPS